MTPVKRLLLLLLPVIALLGCSSAHVEWTSYEDLAGKRIGMLTSRGVDSAVRESFPGCQILFYEDLPGLSLALEKQQIDAFVCMREGSDMMLERHPHFRILPGPGIPDSSAVGFRPDDILLAGEFNAFLSGIRADGTYDRMMENWFGAHPLREPYEAHGGEGKPFRVGIEVGQTFLTFAEGHEEAGLEPELMARFAAWLGRPVQFVEMTGSGLIPSLLSGKVDAIVSGISPTPERRKRMLLSDVYESSPLVPVVLRADVPLPHQTWWKRLGTMLYDNIIAQKRYLMILDGLFVTLLVTLASIFFGGTLGAALCWVKRRRSRQEARWVETYCTVIESIPIVVLLLFMFYVVFAATTLTATVVAIITFSLHFAASACACLDESIGTVDKGQWEAGLSLGFTRFQTFRYVILPQATPRFLSLLKGSAIGLIESTSIVGFIALKDMTKVTDIIRSQTYDSLIPLTIVAVLYFLIARLISVGLDRLACRYTYNPENR